MSDPYRPLPGHRKGTQCIYCDVDLSPRRRVLVYSLDDGTHLFCCGYGRCLTRYHADKRRRAEPRHDE